MSKPLTKADILGTALKRETVPVPEWGGDLIVSEMTSEDKDYYDLNLFEGEGKDRQMRQDNMRARLLSFCIVDETGARIFATEEEVAALGRKSSVVIGRLFEVAQRLNNMSQEAVEEAKKPSGEIAGSA